jgi:integrase
MQIKGLYHMPGSRFYWYRWTGQDGKRRAVSLKTDDLPEAVKKVEALKAGEAFAHWETPEPARTFATRLVEDYLKMAQKRAKKPMRPLTAKKQGAVLFKFLADARVETARDINLARIEMWLEKSGRNSADTRHTYARILKTFVGYLVKQRLLDATGFERFDIPERAATGRKNWLKLEVANRVISESKDPDLTFTLYCGFHAGLRKSEIIAARVNWFDLEAGLLHVQNDPASGFILKDRENRSIQLTTPFKEFLRSYLAGKDPGAYALRPEKAMGKWEYRYDFSRTWETHMERCGVTCTIHDARRSFASNLVSRGEPVYTVAKWLGDGYQVVERSYGHLSPDAGNINRLMGS